MSIFITLLAFDTETLIISSKISIMTASLSSGIIGYTALRLTLPAQDRACLLYTSDAADERSSVDLGGRRNIKKKT